MLILQENSSLANVQYLTVGNCFQHTFIGRYVVVKLNSGLSFICRVWKRNVLNSSYCIVDPTVEIRNFLCIPPRVELKVSRLFLDNYEIIPAVNVVKSLNLNLVFTDSDERTRWMEKPKNLVDSLREVLKLFVISSESVIHLNRLKEFDRFGIHSIHILSLSCSGFGRVIKTTKVQICKQISLITYSQLYSCPNRQVIFHFEAYHNLCSVLDGRMRIIKERERNDLNHLTFLQQVLIIGSGGCGKSDLVKKACYDYNAVVLPLDVSEILCLKRERRCSFFNGMVNQARSLSHEANSGLCVILIKHLENIKSKSGNALLLMKQFLEDLSNEPRLICIATTDSPHFLDASFRSASKFSIEVYLSAPDEKERFIILNQLFYGIDLHRSFCMKLARNTPGFVLSDLVLVARRSLKILSSRNITSDVDIFDIIESCIRSVRPSTVKGAIGLVPTTDCDISSLGGLEEIKKKLLQSIVWPISHADSLKRLNIPSSSGVLLYGPPGCAKTSLVRAAASSCKTTFLSVSAADLYSPFVGDAEKTITELFQRARASAPTVLFIDEIDALVGSRTFREKGVQERILSSFLTELDGVGFKRDTERSSNEEYDPTVIVVAATNRPQVVDSALLRPGRLDKLIYVPPPDEKSRFKILYKITENISLDKNLSLLSIAEKTNNYSGADLLNLCREAGLHAVTVCGTRADCITQEHFNHAFDHLKPSLDPQQIKFFSEFTFG